MKNLKVKICCIKNIDEAQLAIQHGATAIGLVGHMPSGPGIISDEQIAAIASAVPDDIETFLLTSETEPEQIIAHHRRTGTSTIQLVDQIDQGAYAVLRKALPHVKLIQVIHVQDHWSIEAALRAAAQVDALLLDSGQPDAQVRTLGGTGNTHNWEISRMIVEAAAVPVYLAGGLKAINVAEAIEKVKPHGLDLCSGVRSDDRLDKNKLKQFFDSISQVSW